MKLISWNVNGLRACIAKGFQKVLEESQADIFCIQETKMQPGQADLQTAGYKTYFNSAERKGYSGTAVFTKQDPIAVAYGLGIEEHDHEGRVITLEYPGFFLVNAFGLSDAVGGCVPRIPLRACFKKGRCRLRRHECGCDRDGYKKCEGQ